MHAYIAEILLVNNLDGTEAQQSARACESEQRALSQLNTSSPPTAYNAGSVKACLPGLHT